MKLLDVPTSELSLHPALKAQPGEWPADDPRFEALCLEIRAQGILHPLIISPDKHIIDGRHRWRAAKRLGLETVPCREVQADEALAIIVGTLLARRHYTPGQRAYLIADVIEEAWELAREREEANRRQNFQAMIHGANAVQSVENQALTSKMSQNLEASWLRPTGIFNAERRAEEVAQTVGAYAQRLGISLRLLQMAREIWELYRAYPQKFTWSPEVLKLRGLPAGTQLTLREYFEPLVLDDEDPMGLGRVKEGIAQKVWQARREAEGMRHCGRADVLRDNQRQLRLFYQLWSSFRVRACEYWPKLPPEAKVEVCNKLINAAEAMPEEFVSQVAAIFQRELNRRRKQRERERKQPKAG